MGSPGTPTQASTAPSTYRFTPPLLRQRRLHYAHQAQAAAGAGKPPDGHPLGEGPPPAPFTTAVDMGDAQVTAAQPFPPTDPNQPPQANDFRARFHRSLVAPSPFRSFAPPTQPSAPADGIDPHLGAEQSPPKAATATAAATTGAVSAIDPKLGQARGEAEGVVGRLERG